MKAFFEGRPRAHVVIEVGTHSRWVSLLLKELGHQVTVANPRRVKLISQSNAKNDRKDAELLARLGRADVQLLAPIEHRGDEVQADLAIAKARDALVVVRTKLVNQARGLTKSFGYRLPKCIAASFFRLTREFLPKELEPALGPIYESLEQIAEQIHQFDKKLEELTKKYPDAEVVGQIHGVGLGVRVATDQKTGLTTPRPGPQITPTLRWHSGSRPDPWGRAEAGARRVAPRPAP
jgi:transposase